MMILESGDSWLSKPLRPDDISWKRPALKEDDAPVCGGKYVLFKFVGSPSPDFKNSTPLGAGVVMLGGHRWDILYSAPTSPKGERVSGGGVIYDQ